MWKQHAIAFAVVLALVSQQGAALAQSQDMASANYLMPGCRNFVDGAAHGHFLQGACAGVVRATSYFGRSNLGACVPEGTTFNEATKVIIVYVDERPERMHERFEKLALEALQQAWPCTR